MGALTGGNVRVSLHPQVTEDEVHRFLAILPPAVARVRAALGDQPTNKAQSLETEQVIDSRGRRCPLPVLDLARALPALPVGAELTVLADDPAAASDLAAWCRMTGQQLVSSRAEPTGGTGYRVRRVR
jgi:cysteine desulfurase